jgi:hypothetical protein
VGSSLSGEATALLRRARATGLMLRTEDGRLLVKGSRPPDDLMVALRHGRDDLIRVLRAETDYALAGPPPGDVRLDNLPSEACPACGTGLWWRVSVMSGGPGPWRCMQCAPPDPADWIDGCAVPVVVRTAT